jgi:heme oxygenase
MSKVPKSYYRKSAERDVCEAVEDVNRLLETPVQQMDWQQLTNLCSHLGQALTAAARLRGIREIWEDSPCPIEPNPKTP